MKAEYTTLPGSHGAAGRSVCKRDPRDRELEQATKGLGMELNS